MKSQGLNNKKTIYFTYDADKDIIDHTRRLSLEYNSKYLRTSITEDDIAEDIKRGANVNFRDVQNNTPLLNACHAFSDAMDNEDNWNLQLIGPNEGIIDMSADKDIVQEQLISIKNIIKLLIDAGADVNCFEAINDNTPLHMLCRSSIRGHQERYDILRDVMKMLIEHGAKIDEYNHERKTPMLYALSRFNIGAACILIDLGCSISKADRYKCTPLHHVCMQFNSDSSKGTAIELLRKLITHGADVNAKDNEGKIPEKMIKKEEDRQIYRSIIANMAVSDLLETKENRESVDTFDYEL